MGIVVNFETLEYSIENRIGVLKLNRPKALNALNTQLLTELKSFLEEVNLDEIRCLVVTGGGEKSFVAGADIKEMSETNPDAGEVFAENGQKIFSLLENLQVPTIAAVNGFALGGGLELALSCDFILASEKAKVGLPEVGLGLIPGYGGTQRLSRVVGKSIARFITLTGDIFSAQQAYEWGLAVKLYPAESFMQEVLQVAQSIAAKSPKAMSLAKKSIHKGYDQEIEQGMKTEAFLFGEAFKSEDKVEGVSAFVEKRKPEFSGK